MTDLPVTHAIGAVVVTRSAFDKLSPQAQQTIKDLSQKYFAELAKETTGENERSIQVLKDKGIQIATPSDADRAGFDEAGRSVREKLAGTLYSREVLDSVLRILDQVRSGKPGAASGGGR